MSTVVPSLFVDLLRDRGWRGVLTAGGPVSFAEWGPAARADGLRWYRLAGDAVLELAPCRTPAGRWPLLDAAELTVLQRVDRQVGALALPAHAWTDLLARLRSRNGGGNG